MNGLLTVHHLMMRNGKRAKSPRCLRVLLRYMLRRARIQQLDRLTTRHHLVLYGQMLTIRMYGRCLQLHLHLLCNKLEEFRVRRCEKLCTAKLCLENQNKTYRDQSYPKAFPQINKRESNFPCSLAQITPDNKQRFNTHSVSLARA